ncbi:hypothetical protein K493DRAFT_351046 [Basidiobolus meristosporus CBS 931.73]|uniref:Uncharacterized protein n=1 Tax=Basidiobolus meristosporus CBS 931.73 TaxID=1314790 RepID=A0A1Y1YDH4_9FUNG|nr:hypothetical protein K493DRAFT_351046 [Basidiobolus meristosporus CBS 931.73]|eukprot:ORX96091.1 hypothetical protein K493DRAFT_351046 [Basidiobolus meristosporus CBS 931.73]
MIDIQEQKESLGTSTRISMHSRSTNTRFRKRSSRTSKHASYDGSREELFNDESASETEISSSSMETNNRKRSLPEKSGQSSDKARSSAKISRQDRERVVGVEQSNQDKYPSKSLSAGSSHSLRNATRAQKRKRGNADLEIPSDAEIGGSRQSPTSTEPYEPKANTKVPSDQRCSASRREKNASEKCKHKGSAPGSTTYLPKEERCITIQRLDTLRDEYQTLSAQYKRKRSFHLLSNALSALEGSPTESYTTPAPVA